VTEKIAHDEREIRCPKLGHELTFAYCRREGGHLPCARIIRCWESLFSVESFMRDTLDAETWDAFCRQAPPDKMTTLLDLIEKAKARQQTGGSHKGE
jgi:hypothetical protein